MKVVIQRVSSARVKNNATGEERKIDKGIVVLAGFSAGERKDVIEYVAEKLVNLRVFPDASGSSDFSLSVKDAGFSVLLVPQFTLYGDTRKGRRPDFSAAARAEDAEVFFELFVKTVSEKVKTQTGWFGAYQEVNIAGDGPVTLVFEK